MQPSDAPPASSPPDAPPEAAEPLVDHEPDGAHIHLPPPTIWPPTVAFGVALAGFGLVTTFILSFLGIAIMIYAIAQWVQELRHEPH